MGELVGHDGAPFPRRERRPVSQPPAPGSVPFAGDIYQRRQGVNCSSLGTCCNRRRARSIISRDLVISSPSVFIRSSQCSKAPSARLSAPTSDANERFDQGEHAYFGRMLFWGAYYRRRPWPCDAMYLSCL